MKEKYDEQCLLQVLFSYIAYWRQKSGLMNLYPLNYYKFPLNNLLRMFKNDFSPSEKYHAQSTYRLLFGYVHVTA